MNNRNILKYLISNKYGTLGVKIITISLVVCLLTISLTACSTNKGVVKVTKDETFALGTFITIKVYSYDKVDSKIFEEIFDRIRDIENRMTINKGNESEVMKINNNSGRENVQVSEDTLFVIKKGLEYSRLTNGRFDITVEPLVKLWSIGFEGENVPDDSKIKDSLNYIDFDKVTINENDRTIMLQDKEMGIDLGGIAKGYAADEVAKVLKENGEESAIINLGGNVLCYGSKPDGSAFKIGIQNPFALRGGYVGILPLKNKTLVTSGIYERNFEKNGIRYHHILDTSTGYPVQNQLEAVSIVTEFSIDADALSTGVFSMGLEEGYEFVENLDGVDAIFITHDKKIYITSGVKESFQLTDATFKKEEIK